MKTTLFSPEGVEVQLDKIQEYAEQKKMVTIQIKIKLIPRETTVLLSLLARINEMFRQYSGESTEGANNS
jgi:hypothetical protein